VVELPENLIATWPLIELSPSYQLKQHKLGQHLSAEAILPIRHLKTFLVQLGEQLQGVK
jgi:hypothetical protein